jgi:hypothetical protein
MGWACFNGCVIEMVLLSILRHGTVVLCWQWIHVESRAGGQQGWGL